MLHIANKMREFITRQGDFNGVFMEWGRPECEYQWDRHYAIVDNFYWDTESDCGGDYNYFDNDAFSEDIKKEIENHFRSEGETIHLLVKHGPTGNGPPKVLGDIYATVWTGAQELEVYRHKIDSFKTIYRFEDFKFMGIEEFPDMDVDAVREHFESLQPNTAMLEGDYREFIAGGTYRDCDKLEERTAPELFAAFKEEYAKRNA